MSACAKPDFTGTLEDGYRGVHRLSGRQAKTGEQRWELVDRANRVRPMTWA